MVDNEIQQQLKNKLKREKQFYRISVLGLIIAPLLLIGSWWVFSLYKVNQLDQQSKKLKAKIDTLETKANELRATQEDILDFLAKVTSEEQIRLFDPDVDWNRTKKRILDLPPGKRKQAILAAILLAWKEIPFELNQESLSLGFDSPRFIRFVLSQVGLEIADTPGIPLSVNMMQIFEQVENPLPGDLIFYRGQVGNFAFIYLSEGSSNGKGVGIGTLQRIFPLLIMDTVNVNTQFFPFIGYFRVRYPDE